MGSNEGHKGSWLFGLILFVLGLVFMIENFTTIEVWDKIWRLWPIILVIWGIKEIWQRAVFFGLILVILGGLFLARYFFSVEIADNIWRFWPVVIIALGIDQIFKALGRKKMVTRKRIKEEEEL
ncbi:MAG: hypothetical protein Kow00103_11320 [Candidatus Caldatribacteriota bacterium]